ncbi:MAG: RNA-splicing ligase RtcB [Deltaproteobacteria bacterium RIFOXYA12_FULL_61_11]|nr:MAG: RNA-splicing ligase RtcB [Deltaproteobacteria bacterium RIFOXYA12_FULL_61_11]
MKFTPLSVNATRVEPEAGMRVPAVVYANPSLLAAAKKDRSLEQLCNVACLPGIVGQAVAMPDLHWGYGFPIGGVAAFDLEEGVVSPGGVGYDINCGVRLVRTSLPAELSAAQRSELLRALSAAIPTGVGSTRKDLKLTARELRKVLTLGAAWATDRGYGQTSDLEACEDGGMLPGADPAAVGDKALERSLDQLGTLGSGNHFVELCVVAEVFDSVAAHTLGLAKGDLCVALHTGSRGLGHQVCEDYLKTMQSAAARYGFTLPDRQLSAAPLGSPEGRAYFAAMLSAANFAYANRQVLTGALATVLQRLYPGTTVRTVYDLCHNIAKLEPHFVEGRERTLCVHRKGATRAFPPGHPLIPERYRALGQPILVPGDMRRGSFVLLGTERAETLTFASACHGAGRVMSRQQAKHGSGGREVLAELRAHHIEVLAASLHTVAEERPEAYKDVAEVIAVLTEEGLARLVLRLRPLGGLKG